MWKVEPNINLFSQQQQATDNNSGQSDPSVFPAKTGETKIGWNINLRPSPMQQSIDNKADYLLVC